MKKIHLTETEFHDLIENTVKQILSELDWNTYANASDKTRSEMSRRTREFGEAAREAFDRDYGYSDNNDGTDIAMAGNYYYKPHVAAFKPNNDKTLDSYKEGDEGTIEDFLNDRQKPENAKKAYYAAKDEMQKFKDGKYKYKKGKGYMHNIIKETIINYLNEPKLPQYEQPVFLDCTSKNDADMAVELAYSPLQSSLFYVGECGGDGYKALEKVIEYMEENNIIDNYEADEELVKEYPDDFIEVNGHYFDSSRIAVYNMKEQQ